MRIVSLNTDVIVTTSRVWQTTCTAVCSGGEAFLIDSPVYPDELEALPAVLEQAGFGVCGLLTTHADWDHLLGKLSFPELPLGCSETTAARLAAEPGSAQRELRDFDCSHYVERQAPLQLGSVQSLPVPGFCAVGEQELELHPTDGHTADGMAVFVPWTKTLICGDYISPVELPTFEAGGSLSAYMATLDRLRPLVEQAETVVPGHGQPLGRDRALEVLAEDIAYLEALVRGGEGIALPAGRDNAYLRKLHADNVELVQKVKIS